METFRQSAETWQPPMELQSTARQVQLTRAGKTAVIVITILALGGIGLTTWITNQAKEDARRWQAWQAEAVPAQGRVTQLRRVGSGKNESFRAEYSYRVGELTYGGASRINRNEWRWLRQGDTIQVFYRRSEPGQSWMSGHEPKGVPSWVGLITTIATLLPLVLLAAGLRRQVRLLQDGWPAEGTVTRVVRAQQKQGAVYRIDYSFKTMNGESVTGRSQASRNIPAEGSPMTVLYMSDRPKRNAPYPMSLVKVRDQ